jgi:hypothetical protein
MRFPIIGTLTTAALLLTACGDPSRVSEPMPVVVTPTLSGTYTLYSVDGVRVPAVLTHPQGAYSVEFGANNRLTAVNDSTLELVFNLRFIVEGQPPEPWNIPFAFRHLYTFGRPLPPWPVEEREFTVESGLFTHGVLRANEVTLYSLDRDFTHVWVYRK